MRLPRGESAVVDLRKITDYLLSPNHPLGRHKARVFARALGLKAVDASHLAAALAEAARVRDAVFDTSDGYGERFHIDFPITFQGRQANLRSAWLVPPGSSAPILLTAYVL